MDASGVVDSLGAMKWIKVIVTSIDFDGNAGTHSTVRTQQTVLIFIILLTRAATQLQLWEIASTFTEK